VNEPFCLYRNNDGRSFTEQSAPAGIELATTPQSGWGAKLFDYDNDGWLDLLFVDGHATDSDQEPHDHVLLAQPMLLFHNDGGRFSGVPLGPLSTPIVGRGAAFADYDNDGFPDALVVDMEGPVLLLHNEEARRQPRAHW